MKVETQYQQSEKQPIHSDTRCGMYHI